MMNIAIAIRRWLSALKVLIGSFRQNSLAHAKLTQLDNIKNVKCQKSSSDSMFFTS